MRMISTRWSGCGKTPVFGLSDLISADRGCPRIRGSRGGRPWVVTVVATISGPRRRPSSCSGPLGTRKTTFAKGVASRLGWPFVELFPSRFARDSPTGLVSPGSTVQPAGNLGNSIPWQADGVLLSSYPLAGDLLPRGSMTARARLAASVRVGLRCAHGHEASRPPGLVCALIACQRSGPRRPPPTEWWRGSHLSSTVSGSGRQADCPLSARRRRSTRKDSATTWR